MLGNRSTEIPSTKDINQSADRKQSWTDQIRYNKSFVAKLALSDYQVKEFYASLATKFLSYRGVRSVIGWSGVTFLAGRETIAKFLIKGKTLCLYLAVPPENYLDGKYRAKDVSSVRKYEKTPSLFKIKSAGGVNFCLKVIEKLAEEFSLEVKAEPSEPVSAKNFPLDTFNNLLTRGLIRVIRSKRANAFDDEEEDVSFDREEEEEEDEIVEKEEEKDGPLPEGIYSDTVNTVDELVSRYALYGEILDALASGDATAKLSRKLMLRSIDEMWVSTIEDSLLALDELIRKPKGFIAETEEVLPIEMTKKINGRSIQHLSMHTDYISKVEGDEVTPTKMLNIFREDSLLTYENKFLNTLLSRLYIFVNRRYRAGLAGVDEKVTELEFSDRFIHGDYKGKITLSIELSQKTEGKIDVKNYTYDSGLWKRVEKLNGIVGAYMNSSFVAAMSKAYITPPVMRTNAILKNKYFRQCLALWEFIESYDDSGYGLTIDEKREDVSPEYIRQIYSGAAMQYLLFRHNAQGDYDEEKVIASYVSPILNPRIVEEIEEPKASDYDIVVRDKATAQERDVLFALEVALNADEQFDYGLSALLEQFPEEQPAEEQEETEETAEPTAAAEEELSEEEEEVAVTKEGRIRISRSFHAKMAVTNERTKEYFEDFANYALSYRRVKARVSWNFLTLNAGRDKMIRVAVKGRTLCLYLALDPDSLDRSVRFRNVSGIKKYEEYPVMIRVKSGRALKSAKKLVDLLAEKYGLKYKRNAVYLVSAQDYPEDTFEGLLQKGFIRMSGGKPQSLPDETLQRAAERIAKDIAEAAPIASPVSAIPEPSATPSPLLPPAPPYGGTERTGKAVGPADEMGVKGISEGVVADDLSRRAETQEEVAATETHEEVSPIENIVRAENLDYSNPEFSGKDDSAGFIADQIESGNQEIFSVKKKRFRLFGRKNKKK